MKTSNSKTKLSAKLSYNYFILLFHITILFYCLLNFLFIERYIYKLKKSMKVKKNMKDANTPCFKKTGSIKKKVHRYEVSFYV